MNSAVRRVKPLRHQKDNPLGGTRTHEYLISTTKNHTIFYEFSLNTVKEGNFQGLSLSQTMYKKNHNDQKDLFSIRDIFWSPFQQKGLPKFFLMNISSIILI